MLAMSHPGPTFVKFNVSCVKSFEGFRILWTSQIHKMHTFYQCYNKKMGMCHNCHNLLGTVQWASLNSASKDAEKFGPIKQGPVKWVGWQLGDRKGAGKDLCPGKSGWIKRDAQLSRVPIKRGPLYIAHLIFADNSSEEFSIVSTGVILNILPQGLLTQLQETSLDLHHVNLRIKSFHAMCIHII